MNRRKFCTNVFASATGLALGGLSAGKGGARPARDNSEVSTPVVPGPPDSVTVFFEGGEARLRKISEGMWQAAGMEVQTVPGPTGLNVSLSSPKTPVTRLRLR